MSRFKKIVIALVLVSVGLGLWLFFEGRNGVNKPIRFSDGSVLRFRGITYGTNHVYRNLTTRIVRFLPDNLETNLQQRFPNYFHTMSIPTLNTTVLIWLDRWSLTNRASNQLVVPRFAKTSSYTVSFQEPNLSKTPLLKSPYWWGVTSIGFYLTGEGIEDFNSRPGIITFWKEYTGSTLLIIPVHHVPPNSKYLECVIFELDSDKQFQEIGRFHFKNPSINKPQ